MFALRIIVHVPIVNWVVLGFLFLASYYDIRYRTIPVKLFIVSGVLIVIYTMSEHRDMFGDCFAGAFIGVVLLLIGRITEESIGYGDGIVFILTGLLFGFRQNTLLLCVSLVVSTVYSVCLIVCRKGKNQTSIPFLPCVLIGSIIITLSGEWNI